MSDLTSASYGSLGWKKDKARIDRTFAALLGRGVDSANAQLLCKQGWTLGKLKQRTLDDLLRLEIPDQVARNLLIEKRPPIPFVTLAKVLIANRMICCVCRQAGRGVVIHHVKPWATSRSHDASNLAVVCLDDHDRAHKTGGHTQNLTPELLFAAKASWEAEVAKLDTRAILGASRVKSDCWWLFNHKRLFAVAQDLGVKRTALTHFRKVYSAGLVDHGGLLRERNRTERYLYEGSSGTVLYLYVKALLDHVLAELTVLNISDSLDRGMLHAILKPGDFVFLQGAFSFQPQNKIDVGVGQCVRGTRRANGVVASFVFDRWEATATSAWGMWLRGRQEASSLLRVIRVANREDYLRLEMSVIAIGAALEGLKNREYCNLPFRRGVYVSDVDDAGEE